MTAAVAASPGSAGRKPLRLAGVSADYYKRLERGNLAGVSDSVLEAIARALQLDDAERDHLYDLPGGEPVTENPLHSTHTRAGATVSSS